MSSIRTLIKGILLSLAKAISYSISYTLNGGTVSGNPTTYTVENAITLNNPTKDGYTFDGWTGTGLSGKTVNVTIPKGSTGNRSYTANFSPNTYKVKFNANGGTGTMSDQNMTYDTAANLTANAFTKEAAFFGTWNSKADGSGTSYNDKQSVKNLTKTSGGTYNLYAQWIENQYIVIFDKNGGTGTMANQSIVIDETTPLTANAYTRTGYTFKEWNTKADGTGTKYTDKQGVKNLSTTPGTRITLYAMWTPNKYTIKYNANGGSGSVADQSATYDQNVTLSSSAFSRTGYKFNGYNTKADGTGDNYSAGQSVKNLTATNNGTVTLYVKWAPITYKLKFDPNSGTGSMSDQSFNYDEEKEITANSFTKTGYTFEKWNTKADGSGDSYNNKQKVKNLTSTDGKTITLFAIWYKNYYYIAYDKNGGTGEIEKEKVYFDDNATIKNNTFTRTGYHFKEWNTKADGTGTKYTEGQTVKNLLSTVGETYQLYAIWEANTYTIKFDGNKGTGSMQDLSATYDQNITLTDNAFTRNGYTYEGWNTKADGTGTAYTNKQSVKNLTATNGGTAVLYAQWKPITYTITYNLDGGTNSPDNPSEYTPETNTITLKEPTKDLYVFTGWTGSNGEEQQKTVKIEKGSYGNKSYTAHWIDRICSYQVKHLKEKLDGTFEVAETEDKEIKIMTEVTPEVKTYTGFNSPSSQTVTINDDGIVIEYKYTRKSYDITITAGKGIKSVSGAGTYKYGQTVNITVEYEPGFTGAKISGGSFVIGEDFEMPANGLNLSVDATYIKYTITYDLGGGKATGNPNTYTIDTETIVLNEPVREGFIFIGWVVSGGTVSNTGIIPKGSTGDRHFVAQWEVPEMNFGEEYNYTVEHYKQTLAGGYPLYPSEKETLTITGGSIVGPEPKSYEGFDTPERQSAKITEANQVVKYYYPRKSYTVTIEAGEGIHKTYGEGSYKYGSRVFLSATPEDPTSEVLFMMNGVRYEEDFRMPAHDIYVKAIALGSSSTKYRITYDLDGGEEYLNPQEYTSADEITLNEPRKSGYSFTGWTGSNGDYPEKTVTIPKGSSGNKSYKANWKEIDFDLMFDYILEEYLENVDGTYSSEPYAKATYTGKRGDTISPAPREYQGFTSPEKQTIKLEGDSPKTIRYYYQRNTYRLTIEQGQGVRVVRDGLKSRYKYGESFELSAELLNGYENLAWTENGKVIGSPYDSMPPRDVTLHVGATPVTYYIAYDLDGGTNVNNPIKYTVQDEVVLNNPIKDGYTFTGWTGSNGETPQKDITIAKGSTGDKSYKAN